MITTFSFWKFTKEKTIEEVAEAINKNLHVNISTNYVIDIAPVISGNQNIDVNTIKISSVDVKYIHFIMNVSYPESTTSSDSTTIIIYSVNNDVKINILRGNKSVGKLVRPYFNENTCGKIVDDKPGISEDLFYWLFKSYIDFPGASISDKIYLTSLKGYRGVTKDQNNSLKGEGDRISDILGTLAFLLNNDDLKMIRPKVIYKYGEDIHSVLLEMRLTGTFRFDMSHYNGDFLGLYTNEDLLVAITILLSQFIIPNLVSTYNTSLCNDSWSKSMKKDFLKRIGAEIKNRVDIELNKLDSENNNDLDSDDSISDNDPIVDELEETACDIE